MNIIHCVAIDDEPIALSIISEYCRRTGQMELHTFTSPVAGMEYIAATRPQLVFLDIEMNSHNGMELARRLPPGTCLIFTTAYSQYALDGFDVDAVDFLHKPIFYPRFERAVAKARKWLAMDSEPAGGGGAEADEVITLRVEHRNVVVRPADILYVEAMDNYVKIYRRDMPMVLTQRTMKEIEAMLPQAGFVRVHRSYIVALKAVESFANRQISLRSVARTIPVGRKYAQDFGKVYRQLTNNITTNSLK